jgi:hypothetical protein
VTVDNIQDAVTGSQRRDECAVLVGVSLENKRFTFEKRGAAKAKLFMETVVVPCLF